MLDDMRSHGFMAEKERVIKILQNERLRLGHKIDAEDKDIRQFSYTEDRQIKPSLIRVLKDLRSAGMRVGYYRARAVFEKERIKVFYPQLTKGL